MERFILKHYNGLFARDLMEGLITMTRDVDDAHLFGSYAEAEEFIDSINTTSFEIVKSYDLDDIL